LSSEERERSKLPPGPIAIHPRLKGVEEDLRAHHRTAVNCNYDCNQPRN
jgi:hypothetical protein